MIFGVALAVGTWRFVALGTPPAEGPVWTGLLVNTLLFGVFAVHHSVVAREPVKAAIGRLVSPALERPIYVWVASGLFIAVCLAWQPIAGTVYRVPPPWAWVGSGTPACLAACETITAGRNRLIVCSTQP